MQRVVYGTACCVNVAVRVDTVYRGSLTGKVGVDLRDVRRVSANVRCVSRNISSVGANVRCVSRNISSCLLYTSPSPRDGLLSRMPSSA